MPLVFPTLRDFRAAHPARGEGTEVDYGRPWLTGRVGPAYRAAWLPRTGELFAVRIGAASSGGEGVELLGATSYDTDSRNAKNVALQRSCASIGGKCPESSNISVSTRPPAAR